MKKAILNTALAVILGASGGFVTADASWAQSATTSSEAVTTEMSRLLSADELSASIGVNDGIQLIDIRSKKYVKKGTIPGAVWVPFADWRGPKERPGQPPSEEKMEELVGGNGLRLDQPIVIFNHSGSTIATGRSAIVYWLLKTAGAEEISILSGGFKGWSKAGLPEAETPADLPPQAIDVAYQHKWWADPIDIFAVASNQTEGAILDARLDSQVKKSIETGKAMKSMPMARYMPAGFFMNYLTPETMSAQGKSEFRQELVSRGINVGEGMLISICQTGELSALSWFYASEIVGIDNVRYYPDALQGWKSDGGILFGMRNDS